jgi:hypothetical protein
VRAPTPPLVTPNARARTKQAAIDEQSQENPNAFKHAVSDDTARKLAMALTRSDHGASQPM